MNGAGLLWALVVLPAAAGGVLALARPAARAAAPVSLLVGAVTLVLAVVAAVGRPDASVPFVAGVPFALGVDALAALMAPTVAAVTLLVLVFSVADVADDRPRFHGLMLVFAAAALLTTTAQTLPTLLVGWEVMGAMSYALIGFRRDEDRRVAAGFTAFATTRAADLGLYLAAGAALAGGAGLALADLPDAAAGWRDVAAAGILVAALGKAAQLPFSFWLSRAMEGPSPVSALLHSAAMVALGGYLLLRVSPLLAATGWAGPATAWVGAATAVALGAVAVAQRDLKQLLAASTAAQLAFVVMAAGVAAVAGGLAHLVAHAATKALLFLAAGVWLSLLGTKQLADLHGVAHRWPAVGWAATVGGVALAGLAPLSLWATKDAVLAVALGESPALYAVGLVAAVLSAAYAAKVLAVVRDRGRTPADDRPAHDSVPGPWRTVPLVVLAVGAAVLGALALPPLADRLARALGEPPHPVGVVGLVVSAALALAVAGLVLRRGVPEPGWARGWLGLEGAARTLLARPTLRLARALASFDDRVVDRVPGALAAGTVLVARRLVRVDDDVLDGAVEATARGSQRVAGAAGTLDEQGVDGLVERVAAGVRALGERARRPQTGQLHQYYVQAVVAVAVAVVLLVLVR